MYNILELRDKSQPDLIKIAEDLGIKKAQSMPAEELIYAILDQQAIVKASERKDDDARPKQKRPRIQKS